MSKTTLELLLALDKSKIKRPTQSYEITRLSKLAGEKVSFTLQACTADEFEEIGEIANGDSATAQIFTLIKSVIEPNLKDPKLLEAYDATTPKELLQNPDFLLPGERYQLYSFASDLAGYGEDAIVELKNE